MTTKLVRVLPGKDAPTRAIAVEPLEGDLYRITIDGESFEVEGFRTDRGVNFRMGGRSFDLSVERRGEQTRVVTDGGRLELQLVDERIHKLQSLLGGGAGALKPELKSPMTGKVVLTCCVPGEAVQEGQTLVIIEAMKMENEIKAPADTTIKSINVSAGDLVVPGDVLLLFELEAE